MLLQEEGGSEEEVKRKDRREGRHGEVGQARGQRAQVLRCTQHTECSHPGVGDVPGAPGLCPHPY